MNTELRQRDFKTVGNICDVFTCLCLAPWPGGSLENESPCCQYGILVLLSERSREDFSCKLLNMFVLTHLKTAWRTDARCWLLLHFTQSLYQKGRIFSVLSQEVICRCLGPKMMLKTIIDDLRPGSKTGEFLWKLEYLKTPCIWRNLGRHTHP